MNSRRKFALSTFAVLTLCLILPPLAVSAQERTVAVLQGLDKVTARVSTIEAPLNRLVPFGTLEIIVRACHKTPPEEPPESAAFIEIRDVKPGEVAVFLFGGWMFASSPGLSALEHPVYDVWVLDCAEAPEAAEGLGDDPDEPPSSSAE